jgi:hypothetical protein
MLLAKADLLGGNSADIDPEAVMQSIKTTDFGGFLAVQAQRLVPWAESFAACPATPPRLANLIHCV